MKLLHLTLQRPLQIRHTGIGLLYNGQSDGISSICCNHTLTLTRVLHDLGQIAKLEQATIDFQIQLLNLSFFACDGIKLYIILILAITNREVAERYIYISQGRLHSRDLDSCLTQFCLVGDNKNLTRDRTTHIDHRHLFKLLDAFGDYLRGKTTQL